MTGLWFVTPAFERYALSDICFRQRAWAIAKLKELGIEAHCVIVANDENLDIARNLGFETVESDNAWLGKKFNDGYEYAGKHGADWVFPIGSDSWCDPQWLVDKLSKDDRMVASRYYAMIRRDGAERNTLFVPVKHGVSYIVPTRAIAHRDYRPCRDDIQRGCDGSIYGTVYPIKVEFNEVHNLETVAFQSWPQITDYDRIFVRWGVEKTDDPFTELKEWYPIELVEDIKKFYLTLDI